MMYMQTLLPLSAFVLAAAKGGSARNSDDKPKVDHVIFLSIDGLHSSDLSIIASSPEMYPNFYFFASQGVTYPRNLCAMPSDSFPGLAAIVTGGGPGTTGMWYDVSYSRNLVPGTIATDPVAGEPTNFVCTPGMEPTGTLTDWSELMDTPVPPGDGGAENFLVHYEVNPLAFPRDPKTCKPVPPNKWVQVNTIFEVVKKYGKGWTAYSDKHPAYEWVKGPSGKGLDDSFFPEVDSFDKNDVPASILYDNYKTSALVNWILGKNSAGTKDFGHPVTLAGMNLVVVNDAAKRAGNGYVTTDTSSGAFGSVLESAFKSIDENLGKIREALQTKKILPNTLVVISAKHGQGPIDATTLVQQGDNTPAALLSSDPTCGSSVAAFIEDTSSVIWLNPNTPEIVSQCRQVLQENMMKLGIFKIYAGLTEMKSFGQPNNDRNPDIIAIANPGTVYTKAGGKKIMEHGGFSFDEINTGLIVSNPSIAGKLMGKEHYGFTNNAQIAPTIVKALGLDPSKLQAVQIEGTSVLPGLTF